jgi:hypothetical protein
VWHLQQKAKDTFQVGLIETRKELPGPVRDKQGIKITPVPVEGPVPTYKINVNMHVPPGHGYHEVLVPEVDDLAFSIDGQIAQLFPLEIELDGLMVVQAIEIQVLLPRNGFFLSRRNGKGQPVFRVPDLLESGFCQGA